ncbi:MAG: tetratricopeptide repeat protein [Candidatus Handelsmanbacteria bacterium]|nr:tetratricopeptide repeat protein [Candidatus Handelsmanbacteria bacterium]
MLLLNLLIVGVMAATVGLSNRFFSPVELQDRFTEGQKLYALGDFEKAIRHYGAILSTQSNSMINVEEVEVSVDEFILPVRVAATYQLANSYNKLGLELLLRSTYLRGEQKEAEADARYQEAVEKLNVSLEYFRKLAGDPKIEERTRVMAQYQILETSYQLKDYRQTIEEGGRLLQTFPNSVYEASTYYNIAWSYYELKEYESAIKNFEQVLLLAPRGSNADRSLFQISESYDQLQQYEKAIQYLDRLIARYDFSAMSEEELIEMNTLKLKGLVKETARELVAKAEMKKGDIYANSGQIDKALEAYAVIPQAYAAEPVLVQNSYIRAAELVQKTRGTQAAIAAYKNAIEKVEDKQFQARTQLTVALLLFDEKEYRKAAEEYQIYLSAYGNVAARVGFDRDKVLFRLGQCYQSLGQQEQGRDPASPEAAAALDQALDSYKGLVTDYPRSQLVPDGLFSAGITAQLKKDNAAARGFYQRLVDEYPQHPVAPNAMMQLARILYESSEFDAARKQYLAVLEKYPDSELKNQAKMELALVYKKQNDLESAIRSLESIDSVWPQWGKVQIELADLYLSLNNDKQAEEVLNRALGRVEEGQLHSQLHYTKGKILFSRYQDYRGAIANFDSSLALSPPEQLYNSTLFSRGAAYYELAKSQDASGDSTRARNSYAASIDDMKELLGRNPSPNLKDSAFRTLGAGMIRLGQGQEAAQYYEQLINDTPDPQKKAAFQLLLTELYYDRSDFEQARKFANQLFEMQFEDTNEAGYYRKERAYSIVGNSFLQEQRFAEAAEAFAAGVRQFPSSGESANLAFSRAFAEFSAGEYDAAVKSFRAYQDSYPSDRNQSNRLHAQYYLGHAYQVMTQYKPAAEAFDKLAGQYPDSNYEEEALFLVGENNYNDQNFAGAAAAYQKLLEKYPQGQHGAGAQYALAWCFFVREQNEEGARTMQTLVNRYPQSEFVPKALLTIGDHFYNIRSHEEALRQYLTLVRTYPSTEEAAKAKPFIDELKDIQATADYNEVMKLFDNEEYKKAVTGLLTVVEKYPGTYTELAAYVNIGLAYEYLGQYPEAAEYYQKVLEKGEGAFEHVDVITFAKSHLDWIVGKKM